MKRQIVRYEIHITEKDSVCNRDLNKDKERERTRQGANMSEGVEHVRSTATVCKLLRCRRDSSEVGPSPIKRKHLIKR